MTLRSTISYLEAYKREEHMSNLEFIKKLYNGKNCYSDHMNDDQVELIHIPSRVEENVSEILKKGKIVFLTGNPGDGKTFIIKTVKSAIDESKAYIQADLNSAEGYDNTANDIIKCYQEKKPAIIAANEYPFLMLCKRIKEMAPDLYKEISEAKKSLITYDISSPLVGRVAVIDLNERNLFAPDNHLLDNLLNRMVDMLSDEPIYNTTLKYNIEAMAIPEIRNQFVALFELVASECEHYSVRDILGAFSFVFTACEMDEFVGEFYYSALFAGSNELLKAVQKYDPVFLTSPTLDEALWNGEIVDGWLLEAPSIWPNDMSFEDNVEEAVECFKNIKRRYYFENIEGQRLAELQPDEIKRCTEMFTSFDSQKKKIKERIISSINKLFLPSSNDKKQLHIWTTHGYDISLEAEIAISSKAVDSSDLDIMMPRPADWLSSLEYIPNHIILKPKAATAPTLVLDIDFLRTLYAVENGYPIGLLAPKYVQAASMFLHQLDDNGYAEGNDDGEVILASRKKSYKKSVMIQDGKYSFEEDE